MTVRVIIAGGGTGGHLFPGVAIAEEWLRRNEENRVLFIGTKRGIEKRVLKDLGFSLKLLNVEGIKGRGMIRSAMALLKLPGSLLQSMRILRSFRPDIVIGVGGYASGPAVVAARLMGIRTAITEQNSIPGLTNRLLGWFVDRIFLSFADGGKWFPAKKTQISGNPIRAAFFGGKPVIEKVSDRFSLLIFGGSQGAHAINSALQAALPFLKPLQGVLSIVHQTGEKDCESMSAAYAAQGFNARVVPFIRDMASAYEAADLLICRAGATSIAEITAMGKAAILIPFPYAIGDHQTENAKVLLKAGAAVMIPEKDLVGTRLADEIKNLHDHPSLLKDIAGRAANMGNIYAASDIVDTCLAMIKK
ncbi:UDP-N-acetylglucosamine-N-acetylmuramylpentapeptide N-acetylglucosamine transferase [Syntrophus gentianae]|uniref:UDP-N-acetylglucosamine--N-acetylmuramyl-(pentapeptide) pyrophosphoryl-undecaprenol N-acetylglucosamine transferase n=1 Tax=Syntrophus gentianae TaxID=43775 RepID=A0A1H7X5J9_9BACT|nr:undecaprenyldiphospho-muramoylpentapeptide beta-N-acetylglucosaminyltransferase [Syntrophus gentianae]SEM28993.1 UDP-N-acetylglucosamine-N-acetylmuramylpentapeptide N-acetylglucosamine transferase [Syntrophus gentianae]